MTTTDPVLSPPDGPAFCPCCGHNLAAEQPVTIGALSFDPRGRARYGDRDMELTGQQHLLLGSLVAARGAIVAREILAERIGYEGDGNVVDVQLSRLRGKARSAGCDFDMIENVHGRGVRIATEFLSC